VTNELLTSYGRCEEGAVGSEGTYLAECS
jgi:hypothetical protein